MKTIGTLRSWRSVVIAFVFLSLMSGASAQAQSASGTIVGRVQNPANGEYLERVHVTVEGTSLETFTDSDGNYRLTGVPAGTAIVRAFYTGMAADTGAVTVAAGDTARHDISLSPLQAGPESSGPTVKMSEFVVSTSREMAGAAIAINEQRFAPNIKTVVSTDEFGDVAEGNPGEFLQFLPGVQVGFNNGLAQEISLNGVPSSYVPVTLNGFDVASAGGDVSVDRKVEVDKISLNTLSRIEVEYSPTPESQGMALGGSVNMVPRSSFERSHPSYKFFTFIQMRDNVIHFHKTLGPWDKETYKIHPGVDVVFVVPVNKRFGYTLSAGFSASSSQEPDVNRVWRGLSAATGGKFAATTPDKPYMSQLSTRQGGNERYRHSFGFTADYKLSDYDRIFLGFQSSAYHFFSSNHSLVFTVNGVNSGDFTPTSTIGSGNDRLQSSTFANDKTNKTYMPSFTWRHDGPIWKADFGIGFSHALNKMRQRDKGLFKGVVGQRTGVTISFADIDYLTANSITVVDTATGTPVDPYADSSYALISASDAQNDTIDLKRNAHANVGRGFYGKVPVTLKAGLDFRQSVRDIMPDSFPVNYVGPDGVPSTTPVGSDDSAAALADPISREVVSAYGFPRVEGLSPFLAWDLYQAHPEYFALNENNQYRGSVGNSKHAEELVSAAYIRGDGSLFDRRLKIATGLRAEQTNIKAEGPLTDLTLNYQRDASGNVIYGSNGKPLAITSVPVEISKLTFLARQGRTKKEYLRLFPSINAAYTIRENLIARAAWYTSIGRPNFNQYAGGLTLPNLELPPSTSNRITVNNVGIKPWSAKTVNARLEYYFKGVGQISVGAFRREFKNFFGSIDSIPTEEFLANYGLDPAVYGDFIVRTQYNIADTVRMTGVNFDYKQALNFLPQWARGVQVFANASAQRATGGGTANFAGYIPRSGSWGISLTRPKYNVRLNWSYHGRRRLGLITGTGIEPGTYTWKSKRMGLNIVAGYNLSKHFSLYANMSDVLDDYVDQEAAGPSTPGFAQLRDRLQYGSLWTFGVKGTF